MTFLYMLLALTVHAEAPLRDQYLELLQNYPAQPSPLAKCIAPKILLNKETRHYRTTLSSTLREQPAKINFCGKYFLFIEPVTGGGDIYLADCESGEVKTIKRKSAWWQPYVKPSSCLLIDRLPESGQSMEEVRGGVYGPPKIFLWKSGEMKTMDDTILLEAKK